ncbi:PREDICTED: WD repeat-containing and planar cell polarity effector protein fritz [Rhagoletis zephyria]|uniref:WD repeat-containing and planar cell polarity effector protein fritz n=1 Tax=Rhagoletis zephyria TaxID=28612 RepID=UPI0008116990|nr:PREDICTED: WD repeat-containing and planar cell polarity effector protein fritz [Rhagoletis zephyria]
MLTLLGECHLWSIRDEVRIKSTDLGAFRYTRNREAQQQNTELTALAKRDYIERRNGVTVLKNSRKAPGRLKDNIKRLEELLRSYKIVHSEWRDAAQVLLLFANGIIAHICVDAATGDILRMVYEKYFVGKLASEVITDAFFTRSHIVLAYNTNQLTVVHLQKPNARPQGPEKISNMDPRIFHVIIPGPSERKLSRHLTVNSSADLFVIWTKSSQNEVYPWRPTIRDQDRANIHVFKLKGIQIESVSYCWSENDPLSVDFLRSAESQILTVEQKVSRKGEISAEVCTYEIISGKMQRATVTSITMGTQICCHAFSPDQEKLFLGSIDRKLCLHDLVQQVTKVASQIDIIPTQCAWHPDSSIVMVANERAQFQCFDLALTPVGNQLQSEDVTPLNLLDLSHYFTIQPTLLRIAFSHKPDLSQHSLPYVQTDCLLLLHFENGPLGCMRLFAGAGMRGDIHNSGLTADVLIDKYLSLNQLEKAVNLLMALNWETYGAMCLISLHKIANHVLYRGEAKRTRVELLGKALKTFTDALSEETKDEFSDQVFDLKRRFFFYLLRKQMFAEAFEVAEDIEDYDLFMDLFNVTKSNANLIEFSAAAFSQAATILHEEEGHGNGVRGMPASNLSLIVDYRSESACSQSTYSDLQIVQRKKVQRSNYAKEHLKNYVPPLPSFKSKIFSAEMIKINIPKPELRMENTQDILRTRPPPPPPPLPSLRSIKISQNATSAAVAASSTLAELSMKSGSDLNNTAMVHVAAPSVTLLPWQQQLPADAKTPISMPAHTTTAMLPRITTTSNSTHAQTHLPNNAATFVHHASPAVVAENSLPLPQKLTPIVQPAALTASTTGNVSALQSGVYKPKYYQHPLVSGTIPPTLVATSEEHQKRLLQKKPTASILSNSSTQQQQQNGGTMINGGNGTPLVNGMHKELHSGGGNGGRSAAGEKNKVKFSDTVQVAVVPEIPRKEKPQPPKRNGYSRPLSRNITNPKKELADSLPLCHPHDEYLKDFNPLSAAEEMPRPQTKSSNRDEATKSRKSNSSSQPAIKVVHFGVV